MKTLLYALGTIAYFAAFVCAVLILLAIDFIFYGDLPVCMQENKKPVSAATPTGTRNQ